MQPLQLGFAGERFIERGHQIKDSGSIITEFYTCAVNGVRVFVWARSKYGFFLLPDRDACGDEASEQALRKEFMSAWINHGSWSTQEIVGDPLMLMAIIHKVTSEGIKVDYNGFERAHERHEHERMRNRKG